VAFSRSKLKHGKLLKIYKKFYFPEIFSPYPRKMPSNTSYWESLIKDSKSEAADTQNIGQSRQAKTELKSLWTVPLKDLVEWIAHDLYHHNDHWLPVKENCTVIIFMYCKICVEYEKAYFSVY
jgi:hypothetical protein